MIELFRVIESIRPISEPLRNFLLANVKQTHFKKGQFLLKAGQVSRRANFVQQGLLRCFRIIDEKEYTVGFFKEREVSISLVSFQNKVPSLEYVKALENSVILYLTYEDILQLSTQFPEAAEIAGIIFSRAVETYTGHLNRMKIYTPAQRYAWMVEHQPELIQRVPAHYIASYLGISQFTLSRIKAKR